MQVVFEHNMLFTIAQPCGWAAFLLALYRMQGGRSLHEQGDSQIAGLYAAHFLCLGAWSAASINIMLAVRGIGLGMPRLAQWHRWIDTGTMGLAAILAICLPKSHGVIDWIPLCASLVLFAASVISSMRGKIWCELAAHSGWIAHNIVYHSAAGVAVALANILGCVVDLRRRRG